MSQDFSPQSLIRPLSVGNVVSAGFRLYGSHLKLYLGIAVRATLWPLLPFLALIPLLLLIINSERQLSALWLIIPIWLTLFLYCFAKYLTNSALISRLAFGELVSQPESVNDAYSHIIPRMGHFLLTVVLLFMITFAIYIVLFLVFFILSIISGVALGLALGVPGQGNIVASIIIGLLYIVFGILVLCAFLWFFARIFIAEVPLAIENNIGALTTINRSWNLSQGNVMRIILIVIVAFFISLPIYITVQLVAGLIQPIIVNLVSPRNPYFFIVSYIARSIVGLLGGIFILPLWQAIKAVVYYDLRSRREGLGLQLRDREI